MYFFLLLYNAGMEHLSNWKLKKTYENIHFIIVSFLVTIMNLYDGLSIV
jgi:hypothetical protein